MTGEGQGRFERWLASPRAPLVAIAIGVVLALPSLTTGFFADDDALIAYLRKTAPFSPPWYDLYRFTPDTSAGVLRAIEAGQFPWWTAPTLRLHLVRPLSSALFTLDHALFGLAPLGYHVHALLWWALALLAVRAVETRVLPAATASLAVFLFAVSDAHTLAYSWISARHLLVAAAPALFGLAAAIRAREEGWRPGKWLAPLGMIVGLAASEEALGVLAFWASYEVLGPKAPPTWRARLGRAAAPIAVGVVYLAIYAALGAGAHDSGGYVQPTNLGAFLAVASTRFPALIATAFVDFPSELVGVLPPAPFIIVGGGAAGGVLLLWRLVVPLVEDSERAAMRWMVPGALLAMLGGVGGFPGGRLLLVADLAWSALLAILILRGFRAGGPLVWPRRMAAGFLVFVHVVTAPLLAVVTSLNGGHIAEEVARLAYGPVLSAADGKRVFFVQGSDPFVTLYTGALRFRDARVAPGTCGATLSGSRHGVKATRTGPASLLVETLSGALLEGSFESLYRAASVPLKPGDEVHTCGARVVVLAVDARGLPTKIEARFDAPLEDPSIHLVAWKDGALEPVTLSVGDSVTIPWSPGPMKMF